MFFLPIGTGISLRRLPAVTLALITINTIVWIFLQFLPHGFSILVMLALPPARPTLVSAVTSCFLHVSFLHLAGNMIYLWLFVAPVEDRIGRLRFGVLYMAVGVAALLGQVAAMWLPGPPDQMTV